MQLSSTCLGYHRQQRVLSHPVLVHCLTGSGKTAAFLLIAAAMAEMEIGHMPHLIPDMVTLGAQVCQQRKGILREKEHFKQALQGVILHARSLLMKKGKIPPQEIQKEVKSSSDIGDLSAISSQLGFEMKTTQQQILRPESQHGSLERKAVENREKSRVFSDPELTKLADLSLGSNSQGPSPNKKKISKQDFLNSKGMQQGANNPDDPLSQLDPLWSLK